MSDATRILWQIESGDPSAAGELLPLVYDELRKLAAVKLRAENLGQSLQPTALVHEAYLRLVGSKQRQRWDSRGHFFAAAAEAMRRILIDNARRRKRSKDRERNKLDLMLSLKADGATEKLDLLALDSALTQFEVEYPLKAKIVQLRFFAGLTHDEIAKIMDLAPITVKRHWRFARVWLHRQMNG